MKTLNLKINNPCTEEWDKMSDQDGSRLCSSCKKSVVDFSFMSDEQIAEFFNKTAEKVCGRFRREQLEAVYVVPASRKAPWYNKFFLKIALTGLLTLKLAEGDAQTTAVQQENVKDTSGKNKEKNKKLKTSEKKIIAGTVIDRNTRKPIQGALVTLEETQLQVKTGSDGKFSLEVPKDYKGLTVEISVDAAGFDNTFKTFNVKELPRKEWLVLIHEKKEMLMGDVAPDWQEH